MLLVGYCYGIRSERRLSEEVNFNLAYRWFCRLGLESDVPDHSSFSKNRHGRFRDAEADCYTCPAGKTLQRYRRDFKKQRTGINKDNNIRYTASQHDCEACEYKPRCCPKVPRRKITQSIYESSREVARAVSQTPAYKKTRRQRKKVEMLFAHMKRILRLDRLRLRGMSGAHDEFLLTATVQNLRRMAKLLSQPPLGCRIGAPA